MKGCEQMAHLHSVYDTDTHFTINPITRELKNESMSKTSVIQYDHNSERFTFELPRYVEEHDMMECNSVEVHYINIDARTKEESHGIYTVTDMQTSPEDESIVVLSWLIPRTATRYVGSLNFLIRFACIVDEVLEYAWNTAIYTKISVSSGIYNGDAIVEDYPDLLKEWKDTLDANQIKKIEQTQTATEDNAVNIWTATFGDDRTANFEVRNGSKGADGKNGISGGSLDHIKNIGHRGWGNAPENTIPAYRESVRRGFKYVECDVTKTSDGHYVLLHDKTIDRTSNGTGTINQMTLDAVRAYDFGSWKNSMYTGTEIPTFDEFMAYCRNTELHPYIELKNFLAADDIANLVEIVKSYDMLRHCTWLSFEHDWIVAVRANDPMARVGLSCDGITTEVLTRINALRNANPNVFVCAYLPALTTQMIADCKDADIPIEVWSGRLTNDDVINADPYITGFFVDNIDAVDAIKTNAGSVEIFNDTVNPLFGDGTIVADFSLYKTLDIYINLPSYQTMVTMQLEHGGSGNIGGVTGYPQYSIRVSGSLLDSQYRFFDFAVAISDDKREMYIYRSGFTDIRAIADTTMEYWYERKAAYYCVYKVIGHI